ncbi:MAG TPA: hypothetical protein O0X45_05335 [Methanocorpusculum sp.]|nr:hypothetical protein [Methanocorpusculum sp.]
MMCNDISEKKQVLFRMPAEDIEAFDRVARSKRMTRAGLLKQCVLEKIKEYEA